MMRTIIAGSRTIRNYDIVLKATHDSGFTNDISQVVSGLAKGVDLLGIRYALENSISIKTFKVTKEDWKRKGKFAGIYRNSIMIDYADSLIAVWDGKSNGTKDIINKARIKNIQYFVKIIRN